jgi:hypothetical protein
MRRLVPFLMGLFVAAVASKARAGATLISGLGGPVGYGTDCMPPNDDGAWPAGATGLDITTAFPNGLQFYTGTYKSLWINNNGNISFNSAITQYTPDAFPGAPQPMIAPYWADVDTRNQTECDDPDYPGGGGYPAGATCMNPASDGVWWSITPGQFVVTWDQVGFFDCNVTPVMSFQLILSATDCGGTSSGMDFNIEFRYNECGWEAGDASGGTGGFCAAGSVPVECTPAQAGFDSAQTPDTNYASLPMSEMMGISTELCTGSNLTPPQPGVWQFQVRGGAIMCPMAGQPCMTSMPGICAQGQLQCGATGMTTCAPLTGPQPMACNGLDNNCDGMIDDGPCPTGLVCDGTSCVPQCLEGGCPVGQTCTEKGLCVDTACVNVVCSALADGGLTAQHCVNGVCVDDCSGVICPIGQVCRLGSCVDPCAGLNCGRGQVCEDGMCVPTCPCTMCTAAQTCEMTSGKCVATDCATVTCAAGQVCQSGSCVDACTGAVCPMGHACQTGMCVAVPDAGVDAGPGLMMPGGDDASAGMPDGSPAASSDGGSHGGLVGGSMEGGGSAIGPTSKKSGCSCRAAGSAGDGGWAAGAWCLGLAVVVARRRRRLE